MTTLAEVRGDGEKTNPTKEEGMKKINAGVLPLLVAGLFAPAIGVAAEEDGHKLELKVRGVHFDREFETSSRDRTQTGLGLQLNYESPYFADIVGFGVSGYSVTKLDATGFVTTDVLSADNNGELHDSFGKVAQAFVKLKYQDKAQLKIGRQLYDSLLLISSTSRAVPNTYSGASGQLTLIPGLTLYGAMFDEWSRRGEAHFEKFATDRSDEGAIDYVAAAGARYAKGPYEINLEYLNSKDFLTKVGLVGAYTFNLADKNKLKLSAGLHTSRDAGKLFVTAAEGAELDDEDVPGSRAGVTRSDNDGRGVYLDAEWTAGNVMLGAAVAKFDGAWIEDNFTGDHGMNPFPTGGVLADMTNNDETVWMARAGYDWKDYVKGLKTTVKYKQGTGARNSHVSSLGKADESELEVDVRYQIPLLKGLNLRYRYLEYNSDKTGRVDGVLQDNTDHRVYLDYTYRFF
ncbi:Outer membrane porin [Aromatoleum petrolei]|nr:Outer membrane porin [Aromatoleum petrolei]